MSIGSIGEGRDGRRYADTKTTAAYMGLSVPFLEKARVTGEPRIPYIKVGRSVRYDLSVIDEIMARWTRLSTAVPAGAAA
jgi:hypothetical protein